MIGPIIGTATEWRQAGGQMDTTCSLLHDATRSIKIRMLNNDLTVMIE